MFARTLCHWAPYFRRFPFAKWRLLNLHHKTSHLGNSIMRKQVSLFLGHFIYLLPSLPAALALSGFARTLLSSVFRQTVLLMNAVRIVPAYSVMFALSRPRRPTLPWYDLFPITTLGTRSMELSTIFTISST